MFWLAWALWTLAGQLSASPFRGVADWFSTLAFSALMGLFLAAMTLLLAVVALLIWQSFSFGEFE